MIKLTVSWARLFVLAAILVASIGSFHNSITMADDGGEGGPVIFYNGYEEGGGGGPVTCPDSGTCGNFGCHRRSIADPTMVCSRYVLSGGAPGSCPSPVNCS